MPCTVSASRRGVANALAPSYTRPSATSLSVTMRRRSSAAFACMRAGISSENSSSRRSGISCALCEEGGGVAEVRSCRAARFRMHPGVAAGLGKFAHAHDVALPLGPRDHAARIQQIEDVARLDALVIGRQRHQMLLALAVRPSRLEIFAAGVLGHPKLLEQHGGVGMFEIMPGMFLL